MIDELIWEHNRKWVLEGLQALETCPVESFPLTPTEAITEQNSGEKNDI